MATSRFVTKLGSGFEGYLKKRYKEHYKRIVNKRSGARWVLVTHPLAFAFGFSLLPTLVGLGLKLLYSLEHPRLAEILNPSDAPLVMSVVWGVAGGLCFLGLVAGVISGLSKASTMIFDSERDEMLARQVYLMEKLVKGNKNQLRRGASTGLFAAGSSGLGGFGSGAGGLGGGGGASGSGGASGNSGSGSSGSGSSGSGSSGSGSSGSGSSGSGSSGFGNDPKRGRVAASAFGTSVSTFGSAPASSISAFGSEYGNAQEALDQVEIRSP